MKKLALIIACGVCYVCTCSLVYAQDSVAVSLNIDDGDKIRPATLDVRVEVEGTAQLNYMRVSSTAAFAAVKLGYDEQAVVKKIVDLKAEGYNLLEMTLKDLGGSTNWNQVMLSLNDEYPNRKVTIGNYLADAEQLDSGWFKVKIPVNNLKPNGATSHMVFPHTYNVNIGVRDVTFTGDNEPLNWFGAHKFDNARKENQPGQSELIFKNDGIVVDEMKLRALRSGNEFVQLSMPYMSFHPAVLQGENKFIAVVIDKSGNTHYSDTIMYNAPAGISYSVISVSCYGEGDGSIDLTLSGGTAPYTYAWSNGATSADIVGLSAGLYTVEVIDSLKKTASATIEVQQPNGLTAGLSSDHCYDDRAFLNVSGGSAPYQYSIDGNSFQNLGSVDKEDVWTVKPSNAMDREGYLRRATGVEVDQQDNTYFVGEYKGLVEFGKHSIGGVDKRGNYLIKIDSAGGVAWAMYSEDHEPVEYYGSLSADLAVDKEGNSTFIIEVKSNYISLMPSGINLTKGSYLIHHNNKGDLLWIKEFGRGLSHVSVDATGNVYAIGRQFYSSNTGNGASDLFMIKYSEAGELQWKKIISGKQGEINRDMFIDNGGNIYISGSFSVDIDFGGLKLQSSGLADAYIAKLNNEGQALWAKSGGDPNADDASYTITEDRAGNVFSTVTINGNRGRFGEYTSPRAEQVLLMMDARDGSVVWGRPYYLAGFLNPDNAYDLVIMNDKIWLTAQGFDLILREGEDYYPYPKNENMLFEFDYSGSLLSLRELNSYDYENKNNTPIAATSDNHIIISNSVGGFALIKQGPPMRQSIPIAPENQYIVVKDKNGCTFELNDLTFENLPPTPPAICHITSGNNGNKLLFTPGEQDEPVVSYNIYRETFATGEYEMIGSAGEEEFEYLDTTSNTMERSYQYVVTALDGCANESDFSDPHRTMHLTVNEGNLGQINLIWDGYHGFDYSSFKIYRGSSPADMELLTSVPSYLYTFTDLHPSPFTLYYQIRVENDGSCSEEQLSNTQGRLAEGGTAREITSNIAANFGEAGNLTFYPNPAKDRIQVKFSPDGDEYQLKVIDAAGRLVRQVNGVYNQAVIEREDLPSGIYNIVLSKNSGKPLHGRIAFD